MATSTYNILVPYKETSSSAVKEVRIPADVHVYEHGKAIGIVDLEPLHQALSSNDRERAEILRRVRCYLVDVITTKVNVEVDKLHYIEDERPNYVERTFVRNEKKEIVEKKGVGGNPEVQRSPDRVERLRDYLEAEELQLAWFKLARYPKGHQFHEHDNPRGASLEEFPVPGQEGPQMLQYPLFNEETNQVEMHEVRYTPHALSRDDQPKPSVIVLVDHEENMPGELEVMAPHIGADLLRRAFGLEPFPSTTRFILYHPENVHGNNPEFYSRADFGLQLGEKPVPYMHDSCFERGAILEPSLVANIIGKHNMERLVQEHGLKPEHAPKPEHGVTPGR